MKKIIRLARLELAVLFYSPVAWLMLVIFIIQAGLAFTEQMVRYENLLFLNIKQFFLTYSIFNHVQEEALFPTIQSRLYFFIPLLTMGLMSREISSGSIKLVLSSPVKISEIVMGKFAAMMVVGLMFVLVIGMYIVTGVFTVKILDVPHLVCGLIGIYLLICAYSAIGLFMSSLTSYQVVAAILTFALLALLNYIGMVWQNYDLVRDLTYNLSIAGRADRMVSGLLTSREVIYFLVVISSFLGLTMLRLLADRQSVSASVRWLRYGGLVIAAVAIGYISSRPQMILYWDMTTNKHQTLSEGSQQMMRELKEPLEVTTYVNLFDSEFYEFMPAQRNADLRRIELYQRFQRSMKIKYVYYYDSTSSDYWTFSANPGKPLDSIAAKKIKNTRLPPGIFLKPNEVKKLIQLRPEEDNRVVRELKLGDRKELIRGTYNDFERYAGEREWMTAIKVLQSGPAKALFVTGHTEKDIYKSGGREYRTLTLNPRARESFINQGIQADSINLQYQDVPDDIAVLVIPDPKLDYSAVELSRLKNYIDRGGNLLLLGELRKRKLVNQLIAQIGLSMKDSSILQTQKDLAGDFIFGNLMVLPGHHKDSAQPLGKFYFSGAAAFQYTGGIAPFKVTELATTDSADNWLRPGLTDVTDSSKVFFDPSLGDVRRNVPVMVQLERKVNNRDQRIIVAGDADMYINEGPNLGFALEMMKWFTAGKYPVQIIRPPFRDTDITVNKKQIAGMKWAFLGVVPGIVALLGTILLFRRKRK